jgi:hypothetical protein
MGHVVYPRLLLPQRLLLLLLCLRLSAPVPVRYVSPLCSTKDVPHDVRPVNSREATICPWMRRISLKISSPFRDEMYRTRQLVLSPFLLRWRQAWLLRLLWTVLQRSLRSCRPCKLFRHCKAGLAPFLRINIWRHVNLIVFN